MNVKTKVIGLNLIVLGLYHVLMNIITPRDGLHGNLAIMIFLAVLIAAHVAISLITGFVLRFNEKKKLGNAFLLSAGVILLVGFSACLGTGLAFKG